MGKAWPDKQKLHVTIREVILIRLLAFFLKKHEVRHHSRLVIADLISKSSENLKGTFFYFSLSASARCLFQVIADLEEERRKHAEDTAEGDDVTYILEKERERLHQQVIRNPFIPNHPVKQLLIMSIFF